MTTCSECVTRPCAFAEIDGAIMTIANAQLTGCTKGKTIEDLRRDKYTNALEEIAAGNLDDETQPAFADRCVRVAKEALAP